MESERRSERKLHWRVDETATSDELAADPADRADPAIPSRPPVGGGRVVYVDEDGSRRRLPADLAELTAPQRDAAIAALSRSLGAGPQEVARRAAIERLTELRASGKLTAEQFHKERRRLEAY